MLGDVYRAEAKCFYKNTVLNAGEEITLAPGTKVTHACLHLVSKAPVDDIVDKPKVKQTLKKKKISDEDAETAALKENISK